MRLVGMIFVIVLASFRVGEGPRVAAQDADIEFGLPMSQWDKVDVDLEQAFGPDVQPLPGYELTYQLSANSRYRQAGAAIGRLEYVVQRPDGTRYVTHCTATLADMALVITNYHCIPGRRTGETVELARVRFGYIQPNGSPGRAYTVVLPPVEMDSALDYSLLRVEGEPGKSFPPIDLSSVRRPKSSENLFIVHHPLSLHQRLSRLNCQASLGLDLQDQNFYHCCPTQVVSSGAVVFTDEDKPAPVGLHFSGGCFADDPRSAGKAKYLTDVLAASPELKQVVSAMPARKDDALEMSDAAFEFLYKLRGLRAEAEILFRGGPNTYELAQPIVSSFSLQNAEFMRIFFNGTVVSEQTTGSGSILGFESMNGQLSSGRDHTVAVLSAHFTAFPNAFGGLYVQSLGGLHQVSFRTSCYYGILTGCEELLGLAAAVRIRLFANEILVLDAALRREDAQKWEITRQSDAVRLFVEADISRKTGEIRAEYDRQALPAMAQ